MAAKMFSIPGNIKQIFLPFVLDPKQELNKTEYAGSDGLAEAAQSDSSSINPKIRPQLFTFKRSSIQNQTLPSGLLGICPYSIDLNMHNDLSYKTIYEPNVLTIAKDKSKTISDININTILDNIPAIQIREFLPDTRLDQALDFFGKIMTNVAQFFKKDKSTENNSEGVEEQSTLSTSMIDKITRTCKFAVKYLTGFSNVNFYNEASTKEHIDKPTNANIHSFKLDSTLSTYILKFPYLMWYALQTCTTTNIYELPCVTESKELYNADGHQGWPSAGISLANDFITGIPGIGSLVKTLLGNVNISFMPWWDAKEGNATPYTDVVVKFDLFNDTAEHAKNNFIFVNTIVPNAKWIQYNMFQHSPHLYDIKINGYGRIYACSGSFKVTYGGILRNMPDAWYDNYLKKHINNCMDSESFLENLKRQELVKIPDVYHVEMTFKSLLPDTFNNYLYTYSNNSIVKEFNAGKSVYQESAAIKFISDGITTMLDKVEKVWNGKLNEDGEKV